MAEMTETEAREWLREVVADLEAIRLRLLGLQASLPASPAERFRLMEEEAMDAGTEIRTAIACVLQDRIQPAIEDLRKVAASPEARAAAPPPP